MLPSVILKKGRDKSILRLHPWIFSGAIDLTTNISSNGETVKIISADGKPLGFGSYSAHSQIAIRVLTTNPDKIIDKDFFRQRIINSLELRHQIINSSNTNAFRLINSESDYLPGLIVDKYADTLVCQFLSAGAEYWKNEIVNILAEILNPITIYERSDVEVREKEGLKQSKGVLYGKEPDDTIEITENCLKFSVDIKNGHKTGFYLDQRDNRMMLNKYSRGKDILNCFSYTGGFAVYALTNGALKVTNMDSSNTVKEITDKNLTLNNTDISKSEFIQEDVFKGLRKFRDARKEFDIIILDPPKFAESLSQVEKAAKGYKDINLLALKLLKPGGLLFSFSCSGHISQEFFSKIVSDAAIDSGRKVQILKFLKQSLDHPIIATFPESFYLKGIICKVS